MFTRGTTEGVNLVAHGFAQSVLRAGDEVVQLYVRDDYSSVVTFEKMLRGFARVTLAPGETRAVRFTIPPADNTWGESQWMDYWRTRPDMRSQLAKPPAATES